MSKRRIGLSEKKKYNKADIEELKDIEATVKMYKKIWFKKYSPDELIEFAKTSHPSLAKKCEENVRGLEDVEKSLERVKRRCGIKSFDELKSEN
jgi:hypothetical protein